MKYLAVVLSLLLVTACASSQYNYRPASVEISEPPLGVVSITRVPAENFGESVVALVLEISKKLNVK